MKLNLGCGECYQFDWVNVDFESPHPVDEKADLTLELPERWQNVTHVYAGHLLEHLHVGEALWLLARLRSRMTLGGKIMLVCPDMKLAHEMKAAGTLDVTMESLLYGAQRWPGDEHQWGCVADDLVSMLEFTGWSAARSIPIGEVPREWPVFTRQPLWQCAVQAVAL